MYIENYRDTLEFEQLDSVLRSQRIHPSLVEYTTMKYQEISDNTGIPEQFSYLKQLHGT